MATAPATPTQEVTVSDTSTPPLADYRVLGLQENYYQPTADAPKKPGGTCWHCGTGIAVEVVIQSRTTGERHTIGTTCAERVGLNGPELKAMLAERYAEQRYERSAAGRRIAEAERAAWEAEQTQLYGEHGTERRFTDGECRCDTCIAAAPHGTVHRFHFGPCTCLTCLDAMVATGDYAYRELVTLIDLDTGDAADARMVDTRYGMKWCVNDGAAWITPNPKRRSTIVNKGYTEAEVVYFGEVCGSKRNRTSWFKRLVPMSCAIVDEYDEPIERPEVAS